MIIIVTNHIIHTYGKTYFEYRAWNCVHEETFDYMQYTPEDII